MDLELDGKIALVTAATEGLGFACAARLAQAGCAVAICGRREQALAAAREKLIHAHARDVLAVRADIADLQSVEQLIAEVLRHFGRLDILIVNSGHIAYGGLEDLEEQQWHEAYQLLLMSAVRLTRLVVPAMRANKGGDIVFLGSATAREPPPNLLLSTVMRLGVIGLSKTLARALAPENIRVNLVAPGYFDTGRVHERIQALMKAEGLSRDEAMLRISGDLPAGRIGTAKEFAELVAFVASRKAGFMMGSTIAIDGGGSRGLS
jgi:NAD(P)-dependent dehydrogenase (short-subunit alcohol dehydrogenase family)